MPFRKSLGDLDFAFQASVSENQLREPAGCSDQARRQSVVLAGRARVDKSHLAVTLGLEACRHRCRVRFTTAAHATASPAEAREGSTLTRRLLSFTRQRC